MDRDSQMVTGLFRDRDSAERAYRAASDKGYSANDVNIVMSDATRKRYFAGETTANATTELGNKAAKGAGVGGAIGGTIGAIAAAVAAVGTSLVIPGLGLVVAGPVAAALAEGAQVRRAVALSGHWWVGEFRRSASNTTRLVSKKAASSWA